MSEKKINLTVRVWRQNGPEAPGKFESYPARDISTDMSFLEMLDVINNGLERENKELRRANDILKAASAFFAQAELDRRIKS